MPQLDDIIQGIALAGQDDVIEAFAEIGKAGLEAFQKIGEAVGGLTEAMAGFAGVAAGITGALGLWAKHAAEVGHGLEILSKQSGESVESISALQGALSALGGSGEGLGTAFRRMGVTVSREWEEIKKQIAGASDQVIADNLRVDKAGETLFRAQEARKKAYGQPGASPAQLEAQKRLEADTHVEEAEQAFHLANKKRAEDRLNAPKAYAKAVDEIIHGEKTFAEANKEANLSVENVIKGLIVNTKGAAEAFENFHGGINEFIGQGPELKEVFYNLADYMKNSGNAAQNNALMMHLLGRGMNENLILPMTRGREALEAQEEEMKRFGLVITKEMLKPADEFHEAYNRLTHALTTRTEQVGLKLDPLFTSAMEDISKLIEENGPAISKFADEVIAKMREIGAASKDAFKELKTSGDELAGNLKKAQDTLSTWADMTRKKLGLDKVEGKDKVSTIGGLSDAILTWLNKYGLYGKTPEERKKEADEKAAKEKAEEEEKDKAKEKAKKEGSELFADAPGYRERVKIPDDEREEDVIRRKLERRFNMRFVPTGKGTDEIDRLREQQLGVRRPGEAGIPLSEEEKKRRELLGLRTVPDIKQFEDARKSKEKAEKDAEEKAKKDAEEKAAKKLPEVQVAPTELLKKISFDEKDRIKTETPGAKTGEECCIPGPAIDDATKSIKDLVIPVGLTTEAMHKLPGPTENTAASLVKMTTPVNDTATSFTKISSSASDTAKGLQKVVGPTGGTAGAMEKLFPATDQVTGSMNKLADAIAALIQMLKSIRPPSAPEEKPKTDEETGKPVTTPPPAPPKVVQPPQPGQLPTDPKVKIPPAIPSAPAPAQPAPVQPAPGTPPAAVPPDRGTPPPPTAAPGTPQPGTGPAPPSGPEQAPAVPLPVPAPPEIRGKGEPQPAPPKPQEQPVEEPKGGMREGKPPSDNYPVPEQALPNLDLMPPKELQKRWPHGPPKDVEILEWQHQGGRGLPSDEWLTKQRKSPAPAETKPPDTEFPDIGKPTEPPAPIPEPVPAPAPLERGASLDTEDEDRKRKEEEDTATMATGGPVSGWGSGKSDSVPAMLSKGEYVVTSDGSNLGDAIQHFKGAKGYAAGGSVQAQQWAQVQKGMAAAKSSMTAEQWNKAQEGIAEAKRQQKIQQEEEEQQRQIEKASKGVGIDKALHAAEDEWSRALQTRFAEGGPVDDSEPLQPTMTSIDDAFLSPEQSERISRMSGDLPSSSRVEDVRENKLTDIVEKTVPAFGKTPQVELGGSTREQAPLNQIMRRAIQSVSESFSPSPYDNAPKGDYNELARKLGIGSIDEFPHHKIERALQGFAEGGPHLFRGFAGGGLVNGFTDAVASIPGYANGGSVASTPRESNTLGHHELDIRTNAGTFSAKVDGDTMEAIRGSSLGGKLTSTGAKPTWYS